MSEKEREDDNNNIRIIYYARGGKGNPKIVTWGSTYDQAEHVPYIPSYDPPLKKSDLLTLAEKNFENEKSRVKALEEKKKLTYDLYMEQKEEAMRNMIKEKEKAMNEKMKKKGGK